MTRLKKSGREGGKGKGGEAEGIRRERQKGGEAEGGRELNILV